MHTQIFIDPSTDNALVNEVQKYFAERKRTAPMKYKSASWESTIDGLSVSVPLLLKEMPLMLRGVPVHFIRVSDKVEDTPVKPGIYEGEDGSQGQVIPAWGSRLEIVVTGPDFGVVNALFSDIRQGKATPDIAWEQSPEGPDSSEGKEVLRLV